MKITGTSSVHRNERMLVKELYVDGQEVTPGSGGAPSWNDITDKPATYPPAIGTTATTALAGNTHLLTIGTTATTAKAGNYAPTTTEVSNALKAKTQIAGLTSPASDYADLTAVTAALKSVIDALKA